MDKVFVVIISGGEYDSYSEEVVYVALTEEDAISAQVNLEIKINEWKDWDAAFKEALEPVRHSHTRKFDAAAWNQVYTQWPIDNPAPSEPNLTAFDEVRYQEIPVWTK